MSSIDKRALRKSAEKHGDDDILELLDELEAKDRRIEEEIGRANREHHRGFMMACGHLKEHSNVHYADAAEMEIAALRNRINELESTPPASVSVPDAMDDQGGVCCEVSYADGWNACRAAMLQGAADNSPDGWVACSERMPDADGNYWGWWSESKQQGPVWFTKTDSYSYFQSSEITHWMPLPAAPQQEVK